MKTLFHYQHAGLSVLACALLLACESAPKSAPPAKPPVRQKEVKAAAPVVVAPAEPPAAAATPASGSDAQALKDGLALYNDGDYNGAIHKLGKSPEIWNGHNKTIQLSALKTMAFSYCVTSRIQLCRQQFERALKLDPNFSLSPGEIGHPIWGPAFLQAKKKKK